MGIRKSKLSKEDLADLVQNTRFTRREIEDWYDGFMSSCPNGLVSYGDFEIMYADHFDGDSSEFSQHVFRSFDVDHSGFIDFKEFMKSLSVTSRGTLDEKLEWAFRIYDIDGDGHISKAEMRRVVSDIYRMYPNQDLIKKDSVEQRTDRMFETFDTNRDGKINLEEFKRGAKHDPFLVLVMQYKRQRSTPKPIGGKKPATVSPNWWRSSCTHETETLKPRSAKLGPDSLWLSFLGSTSDYGHTKTHHPFSKLSGPDQFWQNAPDKFLHSPSVCLFGKVLIAVFVSCLSVCLSTNALLWFSSGQQQEQWICTRNVKVFPTFRVNKQFTVLLWYTVLFLDIETAIATLTSVAANVRQQECFRRHFLHTVLPGKRVGQL